MDDTVNTVLLFADSNEFSFNNTDVIEILETPESKCYYSATEQILEPKEWQWFCNATWDGLSCWPTVEAGSVATIPCFSEFNGVRYDTTKNASRVCTKDGIWENRSDYSNCKPIYFEEGLLKVLWDVKEAGTIYYVGYGISLVALIAALTIFYYFKNLRCLRNNIHTNLLVTYLLLDLTWIITATVQSIPSITNSKTSCVLVICLTYLMETNFFWMFVEGLYLYILAVNTFSIEVVRMQVYGFIGWGLPAVIVVTWAFVKGYFASPSLNPSQQDCTWQEKDATDYIFIIPVIIVLVMNIFFLIRIMRVLITKLRVANSAESKQFRKASKALLVLIPLLGMTYVLVFVTPSHRTARMVFSYAQAVMLSTQGFTVAILYCFLNGEVQKSLRHFWKRWHTRRSLHGSQRYSLSCRSSQYGENSMRITRTKETPARSSCASFTTTTTSAGANKNSCYRKVFD